MPDQKTKKTLYLDRQAADLLLEMSNASDYVCRLVLRHEREWQGAWRDLLEAGWTRTEIDLAVRTLRAHWMVNELWWNHHPKVADALASAVQDAGDAGIDPTRWRWLGEQAKDHAVSNNLLVLAREFALGNDRARTRIGEPVRLRWGRGGPGQSVAVAIDADVPRRDDVKERLVQIGREKRVSVVHGYYENDDGSLFVELLLAEEDKDPTRVLELVQDVLGVPSAGWHQ